MRSLEAVAHEALQRLDDEELVVTFGVWEGSDDGVQFVCRVETPPGDPLGSQPPWRWWSPLFARPEELRAELDAHELPAAWGSLASAAPSASRPRPPRPAMMSAALVLLLLLVAAASVAPPQDPEATRPPRPRVRGEPRSSTRGRHRGPRGTDDHRARRCGQRTAPSTARDAPIAGRRRRGGRSGGVEGRQRGAPHPARRHRRRHQDVRRKRRGLDDDCRGRPGGPPARERPTRARSAPAPASRARADAAARRHRREPGAARGGRTAGADPTAAAGRHLADQPRRAAAVRPASIHHRHGRCRRSRPPEASS